MTFGGYGGDTIITIAAVGNDCEYGVTEPDAAMLTTDANNNTVLVVAGGVVRLSEDTKDTGGVICDWSTRSGALSMASTGTGDDIALDSTVLYAGRPTAKLTFSSDASSTYIGRFTFTNGLSLKDILSIQIPLHITSNASAGNIAGEPSYALQIWLKTATGQVRLHCSATSIPPDSWHVFSFGEDNTTHVTFAGGYTWASLQTETFTAIDIVQTTIAESANYPVHVGQIRTNAKTRGRVSIRMDGEYISQYTLIKPILDTYGLKVSLAIVGEGIGASASYMTLAQVDQMYSEGHECIHHTYDNALTGGYVNATDWPTALAITNDVKAGFDLFNTNSWRRGLGFAVEGYVSLFKASTTDARQDLVYGALRAAGVRAFVSGTGPGAMLHSLACPVNEPPFAVRGTLQVTNTTTAADVIALIDRAELLGEWAIITLHRAVASSPGSLEMTTANIDTWASHLRSRIDAGGIICDPISTVYKEFYRT
ncbi:MAG: hypothetical protein B7Y82_14360 [Sphingomonadales bacterium 32-65-25]|nr:MAG: hypothetical protein B7Y82_14360 [Sphingomonadales bacterium 32-65-25]